MSYLKSLVVVALLAAAAIFPAAASADSPICHNGILSDDAGMNCADGLYAAAHGGGFGSSDPAICHDGILSDDAGQGCSDGMYERVYGSGGSSVSSTPSTTVSSPAPVSSSGGGAGGALATIRACESGGNYSTNTGNGFYGAYQFTDQTWAAMGGSGHASDASPGEQDARASRLYAGGAGSGNWPNCAP